MQIQLKQVEIIAALKQYIHQQGISLAGKSVDISFTAGRKDAGLIADINIEDVVIPGTEVGDQVKDAAPVTLTIVKPETAKEADKPLDPVQQTEAKPEGDPQPAATTVEAQKAASLFS